MIWLGVVASVVLAALWRWEKRTSEMYARMLTEVKQQREKARAVSEWWRKRAGERDSDQQNAEKRYEEIIQSYRDENITSCSVAHKRNAQIADLQKEVRSLRKKVKGLTKPTAKAKVKKLPSR